MSKPLPPDWKEVPLGDVAEIQKGTAFTSKELVPGDVPVIAGGREPAYYHKYSNRPPNTITVSASGDAGYVSFHRKPIFATDCTTIRSKPEVSVTNYIHHFLKHNQSHIYRLRTGSALPHLYPRDIARFKIVLPPIQKQISIADTLDSVDEAIKQTENVITKTEKLRDALLHELLTRGLPGHHTEWKEVPGLGIIPATWQIINLYDILILNQPGAWGSDPTSENPGVTVLRATDMTRDGRVSANNAIKRVLPERDLVRRLMEGGDIILERSGGGPGTPVGRVALVDNIGSVYCSNFCQHLRIDSSICDSRYAVRALWHRYMKGLTSNLEHRTTGIRNLDYDGYLRLPFPLPNVSEQINIANSLDTAEDLLLECVNSKFKLERIKTSLSEELIQDRKEVST